VTAATISRSLATAITDIRFDDLPEVTVASAAKLLLDHLGVAALGARTPWGEIVRETGLAHGGTAESSVYFTNDRLPAPAAALVNGTYGHGYELDDHIKRTHPACVVIPAALAAAQKQGCVSGPQLLTAIVLGYETLVRLSRTMDNDRNSMSWTGRHATGSMGQFGAAVAAGIVMGLTVDELVSAIGLAGNFATGVCEFRHGSMEKRLFAGRAAESGVLACVLAMRGFTAAETIFEGTHGFCAAFGGETFPHRMIDDFGARFWIDDVEIKRYACCGGNIDWIDAMAALHHEHPELAGAPENIESIVIAGSAEGFGPLRRSTQISEIMSAQYSIPYAVVIALCRGEPSVRDFTSDGYDDPTVTMLLDRCELLVREGDRDKVKGPITIRLRGGRAISTSVPLRWDRIAGVDYADVLAKFYNVTQDVLKPATARAVEHAVRGIATSKNLDELFSAISGP
jgi:2-methylcitrate dehydratase PrpD